MDTTIYGSPDIDVPIADRLPDSWNAGNIFKNAVVLYDREFVITI